MPTAWKALQEKLRKNGANTVYAAREMLAQEYVLQQRERDPTAFCGVNTLSPRATPVHSPLTNISSNSLSRSPPSSSHLPSLKRSHSLSFLPEFGIQRIDTSKRKSDQRVTSGFKSFVDDVIGRDEPELQESALISRGLSRSSSFQGRLYLSFPRKTRRLSFLCSDPPTLPAPREEHISSGRTIHSVVAPQKPIPDQAPVLRSIIFAVADIWRGSSRADICGKDQETAVRTAPSLLPRRICQPPQAIPVPVVIFVPSIPLVDFPGQRKPNRGSRVVGNLLVDFPTSKLPRRQTRRRSSCRVMRMHSNSEYTP